MVQHLWTIQAIIVCPILVKDYHRYWKPMDLNVGLAGVEYGFNICTPAETHTCGWVMTGMMGFKTLLKKTSMCFWC